MSASIYKNILNKRNLGIKSLAVLIDPDHYKLSQLECLIRVSEEHQVDYFFVGGSLILQDRLPETLKLIRELSRIPIILFPGSGFQIHYNADALLFLSVVSGRNADFLIGKQVEAAPTIRHTRLETIGTAYMLIDGRSSNTASYISHTMPIPFDKPEIAVATALASQYLGFKLVYADAGSGAKQSIPPEMVMRLREVLDIPLVVGGGIRDLAAAKSLLQNGADIIVIGNALESNPNWIADIAPLVKGMNPLELKYQR